MKRIILLLTAVLGSVSCCSADTLAVWGFESPNVPPTVTESMIGSLLPDVGSGTASGVHASALTTFSSGVGNGSASSLRADHWAVGDYWQFQFSTVGFAHIQLSFGMANALSGSATNFTLSYSLNGSSFTTYSSNVPIKGGAWNATTPDSSYNHSYDLTSKTALDNTPNVYFRLVDNLPDFNSADTVSVDNFLVTATLIPEPSSVMLLGSAGLLMLLNKGPAGRNAARRRI